MAELVARSEDGQQWWARPLQEGRTVTIGRVSPDCDWVVPWDRYVSRIHALVHWKNGRLWVRRHPQAKNPIFVAGQEASEFTVAPREPFVIGSTVFEVRESEEDTIATDATPEVAEYVFEAADRDRSLSPVDPRLNVLFELPEVLGRLSGDEDAVRPLLGALLRGMPHAQWAALVKLSTADPGGVEVVAYAGRHGGVLAPRVSRRLVWTALKYRRSGIAHVWPEQRDIDPEFTAPARMDWAICVPVEGAPAAELGFYVAGGLDRLRAPSQAAQERLEEDVRFVTLVGRIFGSLCRLRDLQMRQSVLAQFFPRPILGLLLSRPDIEQVLRPRELDVTVLFCDLRGSTQYAEEWSGDAVELWYRISDALALMSSCITDLGGVLGDLQGDAAMGFWGWPVADPGRVEKAARAAVAIYRRLQAVASDPDHPLRGFRCGIGIASGRAVAGRLGTPDQFKVTVYGKVTNVAARLESLTKPMGAAILVDDQTATSLSSHLPESGWATLRRIGPVRLTGMVKPTVVFQLVPGDVPVDGWMAAQSERGAFEAATRFIQEGDWREAARLLEPLNSDPVARVLHRILKRFGYAPPVEFQGALEQSWFSERNP